MTPAEIRQRRTEMKLTQGELAELAGLSAQAIRNYEAGRRTPKYRHLRALLTVFETRKNCTCACHAPKPRGARAAVGVAWSKEEEATLRHCVSDGWHPDAIVAELERAYGHRRTHVAIRMRIQRLGLRSWAGYSSHQAAQALGVERRDVDRWIGTGILPAARGVDRRGKTIRWWHIVPSDLATFVERYAGIEFDAARVRDHDLRLKATMAAPVNRRRAS